MMETDTSRAVCFVCGCSDLSPCPGGCFWTWIHEHGGLGLCSACVGRSIEELAIAWSTPGVPHSPAGAGVVLATFDGR